MPAATYMGGKDTIAGICEELESAGASHVDTFREWTTDFADTAGKNAGLEDSWSDPGKMKADIGKCMDGWEQNHDYSDADCRMTAFLLLDGVLRAESTEDSYEGTYLMFDTEAIDNVDRYESIKENKNMFTTLYGEKSVTDGSHPENTFPFVPGASRYPFLPRRIGRSNSRFKKIWEASLPCALSMR